MNQKAVLKKAIQKYDTDIDNIIHVTEHVVLYCFDKSTEQGWVFLHHSVYILI